MAQFFVCEPCQIMFRDVIAEPCDECGQDTVPLDPVGALSVLVFDELPARSRDLWRDELGEAIERDEARQLERSRHQ